MSIDLGSGNYEKEADPNAIRDAYLEGVRRGAMESSGRQHSSGQNSLHGQGFNFEIIRDPAAAERLSKRHDIQLITPALVRWCKALLQNPSDEDAIAGMKQLRADASNKGFFLIPYDRAFMDDRIRSQRDDGGRRFLIIESMARHPDPSHSRYSTITPAADAQFQLPSARADAEHVIHFPHEGDEVPNPDLVDHFRRNPGIVASFEDLACDPDMFRLSCAKRAMLQGIDYIRTVENASRGDVPIEYVVAEIASVQGIVLEGGVEIRFQNDWRIPPFMNVRSTEVFEHLHAPGICDPFSPLYIRRGDRVAVHGDPLITHILVDWFGKSSEIHRTAR